MRHTETDRDRRKDGNRETESEHGAVGRPWNPKAAFTQNKKHRT